MSSVENWREVSFIDYLQRERIASRKIGSIEIEGVMAPEASHRILLFQSLGDTL
jgi:hypothetical protein